MCSVSRGLKVLVVEDDLLIRMTSSAMLEDAGYEVLEAGDADAALLLLEETPVALLFTDIDMPGSMDGMKLAHRVHACWPAIPLLLTSGNRPVGDGMPDGARFLAKPYDLETLIEEVRGQLG